MIITETRRWRKSDRLELGPYPGAVPSARLHARALLAEWNLESLSADTETVVAELVANSVEAHQRERLDAPVSLTLLAGPESVLVVVGDSSRGKPVRHEPDFDLESGRGLLIVGGLAEWWDWKPVPGGKLVRAYIR